MSTKINPFSGRQQKLAWIIDGWNFSFWPQVPAVALFCLWHDTCYLIYAAAVPSNGQLSGNRRESIFPRGSPNSYISDILLEYWADHSAMSTSNISKECQEAKDILENGWIVHPGSIIGLHVIYQQEFIS